MTYKMSVRQSKKLFNIFKVLDLKKITAAIDFKEIGLGKEQLDGIKNGDVNADDYAGVTGKVIGSLLDLLLEQSEDIYDSFQEFIADITKNEVKDIEEMDIEEYLELITKVFTDINFIKIFKKYGNSIIQKLKAFFTQK